MRTAGVSVAIPTRVSRLVGFAGALAFVCGGLVISRALVGGAGGTAARGLAKSSLDGDGVKLSARGSDVDGDVLRLVPHPERVQHLDLYGCSQISSESLSEIHRFSQLEKLNVSETSITEISPLSALTNLTAVALDGLTLNPVSLAALRSSPRIHVLSANRTNLDDTAFLEFAQTVNLKKLYVAESNVTGEVLGGLETFGLLEVLNLSGTQLRDADLSAENWPLLPNLAVLLLNDLPISDEGLVALSETLEKKLPMVSSIGLGNTKLTKACFPTLCDLNQLRTIRLTGTPIEKEDIEQLRLKMTDAYIEGN